MENGIEISEKVKSKLSYDPVSPLLGICLKEMKSPSHKHICSTVFIAASFTVTRYSNNLKVHR
jgi:hypothetical protein